MFELNFSIVLLKACCASLVSLSASEITATRDGLGFCEIIYGENTFEGALEPVDLLRLSYVLDDVLDHNSIINTSITRIDLNMMVA